MYICHNISHNYDIFFKIYLAQIFYSYILGIYFSLTKQVSKKMWASIRFQNFSQPQLLALYSGIVRLCIDRALNVLGSPTHTVP